MKLKTLNLNGYEARIIGEEQYKELARKHNLFTQKHTLGRLKEFTIDVNNAMEQAFKRKSIFKKLKQRRKK